jgi:hypothetical protein
MRVGGQHAPTALSPVLIVYGAGWAPGPVWTGAENLPPPPPTGIGSPDRPAIASRYTYYDIPTPLSLTN